MYSEDNSLILLNFRRNMIKNRKSEKDEEKTKKNHLTFRQTQQRLTIYCPAF